MHKGMPALWRQLLGHAGLAQLMLKSGCLQQSVLDAAQCRELSVTYNDSPPDDTRSSCTGVISAGSEARVSMARVV